MGLLYPEPFQPEVKEVQMFTVTAEWLNQYKTPRGGYLYQQVRAIGVDWPLVSGWKTRAVGTVITDDQRKVFEAGAQGKAEARETAKTLLSIDKPERPTRAERKARRALRKAKKAAKQESVKQIIRTSNRIADTIRPVTIRGVRVDSHDFLSTFEWKRVRMMALKKYGPVCQCCGASPATGAVMNVDHIKPRKLFPQLALDLDNLQVLCGDCNHGKGNWDMTDWRETEDPPELIRHIRDICR